MDERTPNKRQTLHFYTYFEDVKKKFLWKVTGSHRGIARSDRVAFKSINIFNSFIYCLLSSEDQSSYWEIQCRRKQQHIGLCVCYSFCIMVVVELKVARWYLKTSRSENIYLNSLLILNKARSSFFFLVEQFNLSLNFKLFVNILKSMDSGDVWLWNWISQFYSLIEFHQDYKLTANINHVFI